jgi:hypothetical protein
MANAVNDNVLAGNLENGSMSWLLAQAVKYLTKLKWKIVALTGKRMPFWIFREGLDCALESLEPEQSLVSAALYERSE